MHSSTSSSSAATAPATAAVVAQPYERPVPGVSFATAGVIAIIVTGLALGAWESYWRAHGAVPTYRNSEGLWAMQRERISKGEGNATVLVGSSRMLSNVQLHVWERLDGRRPIQLGLEGTSPLTALEGLADDPNFTGRVYVGVTPVLFFTGFEKRAEVFKYYPRETPSQRAGQHISMRLVEPYFAFYDPDFALFAVLKRQAWPARKGVPNLPEVRRLFVSEADRNMRMWNKLENEPAYQELAKSIWKEVILAPPPPELAGEMPKIIQRQIDRAATAVEKLRGRGVEVVFILHPHDGFFRDFESRAFPREQTWEVLLARTKARGIHFQDHAELQGLNLPEWSHLASKDAERYTTALYQILQRK